MRSPSPDLRRFCTLVPAFALAGLMLLVGFGATGCSKKPPLTAEQQLDTKIEELKKVLRETVTDQTRLDQMLNLADRSAEQLRTSTAALAALLKEQERLNLDYAATPEAFQSLGARMQAQLQDSYAKAMAIRFDMAKLATDAEWKKLTSEKLGLMGL